MSAVTLLAAFSGMAALALRMNVHRRSTLENTAGAGVPRGMLAAVGWCLLAAALGYAVLNDGGWIGAVSWLAALAVGGFAVALVLAFRPRVLLLTALGALLIAVVLSVG
jgi:hypothetical protein